MSINILLGLLIIIVTIGIIGYKYWKAKGYYNAHVASRDPFTKFEDVVDLVKNEFALKTSDTIMSSFSGSKFYEQYRNVMRLRKHLSDCAFGNPESQIIVKDNIKLILREKLFTESEFKNPELVKSRLEKIINDRANSELKHNVMFEEVLYYHDKILKKGEKALEFMILNYKLNVPKYDTVTGMELPYVFTISELEEIRRQIDEVYRFTNLDRLEILATLIYQVYKGMGAIDTLRTYDVDGLHIGTSGYIKRSKQNKNSIYNRYRSVWIYFKGVYMHLEFLYLECEEELKRITLLISRYGAQGTVTEKEGKRITTMYDKSRVFIMRPPVASSWTCIIRKFVLSNPTLENLLLNMKGSEEACGIYNTKLVKDMVEMLSSTTQTIIITGGQGSGKTTFLSGMVQYINPHVNIRTLEMAFELYLEEAYPRLNTIAGAQTQDVSITDIQDAFKKSDGSFLIVGEIATAALAARFIEGAQVGYDGAWGTHHGVTAKETVEALRNNLKAAGDFDDSSVAEQQVLSVININLHLARDPVSGLRFVDRITEIIPVNRETPYPKVPEEKDNVTKVGALLSVTRVLTEWAKRETILSSFATQDIIKFNKVTFTYETVKWFSPNVSNRLKNKMTGPQRQRWGPWVAQTFGVADPFNGK